MTNIRTEKKHGFSDLLILTLRKRKPQNASERKQLGRKPRLLPSPNNGATPLLRGPAPTFATGKPPPAKLEAKNEAGDVGKRGEAADFEQ